MLTEYEAQKLQHEMGREPDARRETVWCAACILILLVLLVVAPSMANGY